MKVEPRVRFLDLSIKNQEERSEIILALESLMSNGKFIISDNHNEFESRLSENLGRSFAVGVNSGTDALTLGLRLLQLPPGIEVITSPFSWLASASCIRLNNLKECFVDCDDSFQIDLDLVEDLLSRQRDRFGALVIPHLHGNVSDVSRLYQIKERYGIPVVEDCAQAFGARDLSGRQAGSVGDVAAFSFNPMKVLGGLGDGGALLFDNSAFLERAKLLRHSGSLGTSSCGLELSTNCRLDALQAEILLVKLKFFSRQRSVREQICKAYNVGFSPLKNFLRPITQSEVFSNHYCYQIVCHDRDLLIKHLVRCGIEVKIRHNFLIPDLPAFKGNVFKDFPKARRLLAQSLCLPIHHNMSSSETNTVIEAVKDFYMPT